MVLVSCLFSSRASRVRSSSCCACLIEAAVHRLSEGPFVITSWAMLG